MLISKQIIDEFREFIANETCFEQLTEITFKKQYKKSFEDFTNNFIDTLLECMLIEKAYEARKTRIFRGYGKLAHDKIDFHNKSIISENSKFLKENEQTFANGLNRFVRIFDFSDRLELLHCLRVVFKNYTFKTPNMVNDYTVLYFTFKMYDKLCLSFDVDKKECAKECANLAFQRLHNPRNKKAVTVTCNSIKSFVRKFPTQDWKKAYIEIFLNLTNDIYFSDDFDEITRFGFLQTFSHDIIVFNSFLNSAKEKQSFSDGMSVFKRSSNRIQYSAKAKKISFEDMKQIKELQHLFAVLGNNIDKLQSSQKKYVNMCNRIFELSEELSKNSNENTVTLFYKVMTDYSNLLYYSTDVHCMAFDAVKYGATKNAVSDFFKLIKKCKTDNVYMALIFSMSDEMKQGIETSKRIQQLYGNMVNDIDNYLNRLCLDGDVNNERILLNLLNYIDMQQYDVPILRAEFVYNESFIQYLTSYIF